ESDQRALHVHFIGAAPPPPGLVGRPEQIRIVGGRRIRVRATDVSADVEDGETFLVVSIDQPGDFSDYVLELPPLPGLDEAYRRCAFNFKAVCPTRFDCRPASPPEPPAPEGLVVDYMAKDYASFRQALIDLIPRLSPEWTE
ncbi:MAG: putative baseplate assembly protein, partial [Gammaproteobacteria bacterium]|nr:putative baseplate assembly protein [Gemmatimonadota bacterium]NIU75020.1 putative baseplate assembly protein [Gammaproteobacteria bacterium]NIX20971.1 putative baseplate assembly protein [Actinomycetota bacterium]